MKDMKYVKNIFLVALAAVLLALTSCEGNEAPSSNNNNNPAPVQPVDPEPDPSPASVQSVSLSITSQSFTAVGQTVQITVTVTPKDAVYKAIEWLSSNTDVATVSNDGLVTCVGFGTAIITVTVADKSASCEVTVEKNTVTDACGNEYRTVKIGSQVWMAENMRCDKYDTQSERAGASVYIDASMTYDPYYTDASNESYWWKGDHYADKLSSEQIAKLGYLYNWAAVLGLEDANASKSQEKPFEGNRQGICPNGWHVPTSAEFTKLKNYVGTNPGAKIKSTSGWYDDTNGTDDFSFTALPAGYANGQTVCEPGRGTGFWTATPRGNNLHVYYYGLNTGSTLNEVSGYRYEAHSLRCVKN